MSKPNTVSISRKWGLDLRQEDTLLVRRFNNEDGTPGAYDLQAQTTTGQRVYFGFNPQEFINFVCDLEELI